MQWKPVSEAPGKTGKYLIAVQPHFGWARATIGWYRSASPDAEPTWSERGTRYWCEIPKLPEGMLEPTMDLAEFDPVKYATEVAKKRGLIPQ